MNTVSGRQIKVTSNKSQRTFTIVTDSAKFRAIVRSFTGQFINRNNGIY